MSTFKLSSASKIDVTRNTVNSYPSIWGDQFLTYDEKKDIVMGNQLVEDLKREVSEELLVIRATDESIQHMKLIELIDVVQRLGIAYHFENKIEEALQYIYVTYRDHGVGINHLQSISLWFRILRQQGFNVSSEIFKSYLNEDGHSKESLCSDIQGMLALYEAAYMRVEGEVVLNSALEFTKIHLGIISNDPHCDSSIRTQIKQVLNQPLRKRLPRLEAVHFIPFYEQQASHNEVLLTLAKLDFNMLQSMHRNELSKVCKWWKDLDFQKKLPYVRDRLIEGYFWILGIYFEPQYSSLRIFLIKSCMWLVVIDDTYDNYGTYEELEIFTQAVERWSICYSDTLPDTLPEYMKIIFQELVNIYQEMDDRLAKEGKSYHIQHIKEMFKEYTRCLLVEAKWLKVGYTPSLKEYMTNSLVTVGYAIMIAKSYVGRDTMVTNDTFKWVASYPPLVKATCLILRLMDDISTHKEEQERPHIPSSIECYQKETGASEHEACEYFLNQVEDAWKIINQESLRPTSIPFHLIMPAINLARVCDVLYKGNDGYKHAGEEVISYIKTLLVHPLAL
ncbi:(E)-beta-farnesene synthase-like [Rutidosis leptorrhynchoides]|uniref:(E)-beta-farnesene synthase-like n=1 Tax=Rutidosis leptorrhynchoides TaxID=125765 RepID=UPI003A98E284